MGIVDGGGSLHPFASEIIRKKARSLAGKYGFGPDDTEDIEQELALNSLQRQHAYDESRGNEKQFIATVVRTVTATLVERQRAAKRGSDTKHISLDTSHDPANPDGLAGRDVFDKESYLAAPRGPTTRATQANDLRVDLDRALQELSPELRDLACQMCLMTFSEIARATGIPRTTVNDRAGKVRQRLRESGLTEYLNFPPSDRRRFR